MQNMEGQLVLYNLLTHIKKDVLSIHRNSLAGDSADRDIRLLQVFPNTSLMKWERMELDLKKYEVGLP
jgi:hypothetical protein